MRDRVAGKVAIVTGGSRGIGAAIASRLAAEGARVVIGDVQEAEEIATASEINEPALFVPLDVRDMTSGGPPWPPPRRPLDQSTSR